MSKIVKIRSLLQFKKVFLSFEANKDNLRFALIAALINATYKIILCSFRRVLAKHHKICDKVAAPIAGFSSALWLYFDDDWRKNLYAILMTSKATDALVSAAQNSEVGKEHFENNETFTRNQLYFVSFVLGNISQVYCSFFEPRLLNIGYFKNMVKWCVMSENEWNMMGYFHKIYKESVNNWEVGYHKMGSVLSKRNMAL